MSKVKCQSPTIPLPSRWNETVRSAVLHVISLAQLAAAHTRGWAANSVNARIRLKAENDRLQQEVQLLREEIRIKDARWEQIPASRRPHYPPTERMAILEMKAARNWSLEQTARTFFVTAATIAAWLKRVDEEGDASLVQLPPPPVNKFPQYIAHVVRRLKTLSPAMGKVKIAQTLARAGLHLGATTVGRMLKGGENAADLPPGPGVDSAPDAGTGSVGPSCREGLSEKEAVPDFAADGAVSKPRVVTAKRPNNVWHVDLTTVPTGAGFCTTWLPFALPQCWPFCWWVAVAVDHFSRRVMGVAVFAKQPTSVVVRAFLGRMIAKAGTAPKYLVCDRGRQFDCAGFRDWCQRSGINPPRYGAVGRHGSIAVVERFILSLKDECTRLLLVPYGRKGILRELVLFCEWFNEERPHTKLGARTPNEVYHAKRPANRSPRFEPRARWARGSPCAKPQTLVKGRPGVRLELHVAYYKGRKHLPIVTLVAA